MSELSRFVRSDTTQWIPIVEDPISKEIQQVVAAQGEEMPLTRQ